MLPGLLVFIGGGLGALARYALSLMAVRVFGAQFPWGTFAINITGSLIMGLVAGFFVARALPQAWEPFRLFLTTGILGGFTTFSAFSLDAFALWERGDLTLAAFYVLGSVAFSIMALVIGYQLTKGLM
jgi:fluoride exporter